MAIFVFYYSVYKFEDCYEKVHGHLVPKLCSFIQFPNHPHESEKIIFNNPLLKKVILTNGNEKTVPIESVLLQKHC